VTLQASPSSDGVEFVTLDEFFVADPSAVYEQIIPPHSPHQNNQNESQNGESTLLFKVVETPGREVLESRFFSNSFERDCEET
jgi:hypothetical protein